MKRKTAGWLFASIFTFALATNAQAAPVLEIDQAFTAGAEPFAVTDGNNWQQGVTAGMTGLLARVDIFYRGNLYPNAGKFNFFLNLDKVWVDGPKEFNMPVTLGENQLAGSILVDVSSARIQVDIGSIFFIGIEGAGSSEPEITGSSGGGTYDGGMLYQNGQLHFGGNSDLNFITYVGQAIPEPTTLLLLGLGLAALSFASRRSTRFPGSRPSAA